MRQLKDYIYLLLSQEDDAGYLGVGGWGGLPGREFHLPISLRAGEASYRAGESEKNAPLC